MKKRYYFRCALCLRRKKQEQGSKMKPGICQRCYDIRASIDAREIPTHPEAEQ